MLRRDFVRGSLKAIAAAAMSTSPFTVLPGLARATEAATGWPPQRPADRAGIEAIPYGAAVRDDPLAGDCAYVAALAAYCRVIVGEGGLKWADIRPTRDQFAFDKADRQLAFAAAHGMAMRGHTLAWYGAMPDWTNAIAGPAEAERELTAHIETVMARYAGKVHSWDVVNEPIPDDPAVSGDLRPSIWEEMLGASYVPSALKTAAAVDPSAQLAINEYDIEFVGDRYRRRREALLRLIRSLKEDDVPLHAVGLQGHLHGELEIDREGLSAFVDEVHRMGLDVLVTELDVIDDRLPGPPDIRDGLAAARAYDFLGAISAAARPAAVLTWGITDKYTWVPIWFKRSDGLPNRPLPLDAAYQPKPLMRVIEHFVGGPG